jgi:(E)-4-hydroxy-3-methyl-but-2-enyl pyrophosphate reductase
MTRVIVDRHAGMCSGVRRAVAQTRSILEERSAEQSRDGRSTAVSTSRSGIVSYGQLVHNREVTDDLCEAGLKIVESLDQMNSSDTVIIRAHGVPPAHESRLRGREGRVVDLTCSRVKRVHQLIEGKRRQGYRIVIAGDPAHPEVKGHLGYAGESAVVLSSVEQARSYRQEGKIAVFCQTTTTAELFESVVHTLKNQGLDVTAVDTLCPFVNDRQKWIERYAAKAQASLIIGGKNSSNTRKLFEIAKAFGKTFWISTASELDVDEVLQFSPLAVTAGASTAESTIEAVLARFREVGAKIEKR